MLLAGSLAFSILTLAGIYLTSRSITWGWLYMAALQVPGTIYDVLTGQYGFILLGAVGAWMYWTGWTRRRK